MANNMYRIADTKTKKVVQDGFAKKSEAKEVRNQLNGEADGKAKGDASPRYVISRSVDHPYGETDGIGQNSRKKFF